MNSKNFLIDKRPWGEFHQFVKNEKVTVKIIRVKTGGATSLQYHNHRSEFWKIISGEGEVIVDNKIIPVKTNDEIFVPQGAPHRIAAKEKDLELLEISFGDFDEDDIVRIEDNYGRS